MQMEYRTILSEASIETDDKKSRFIATVKPVITDVEANAFLDGIRAKYWNATHNVYAYYISSESVFQKFSDDGEPSGTAGLPVLEAIKKLKVQDLIVVVTRYFGGTLLGASGLVRAYGRTATLGIEAAGIITKHLCIIAKMVIEYTLYGKLQNIIAASGYEIKAATYGQNVEIDLYVPFDEYEGFVNTVTEATNARAFIEVGEKVFTIK